MSDKAPQDKSAGILASQTRTAANGVEGQAGVVVPTAGIGRPGKANPDPLPHPAPDTTPYRPTESGASCGENRPSLFPTILALGSQAFVTAARSAFGAGGTSARARGSGPALDIYRQFFRQGRVDWAGTGLSERSVAVWKSSFTWEVPVRLGAVLSDRSAEVAPDRPEGHTPDMPESPDEPSTSAMHRLIQSDADQPANTDFASLARTVDPADPAYPSSLPGFPDLPATSSTRSAAKAILVLADGLRVEMVLIPMETGEGGRASLCVSSQAGCAMGCAFCETGRTGLLRSLTTAEIVAQVHCARFALGWEFSNLVFMGMGEPLDNVESVLPALEVLMDPQGFAFAQERITLCTVGIPAGIAALARKGWKRLGLSLSLNAASQELRESLMPVSRAWNLDALAESLAAYRPRPNFVLALNWCLLPGINNRPEDAEGISRFAARIGRVMVNVIPYNPGSVPLAAPPEPEEIDAFMDLLKARSIPARLRGPKGRSIMAACGQLGGTGR